MGNLFVRVLNMSITAGWIVLAVIVLRMILKKSPKWIHCILWAMVGLRLILPVSITSPLSLIPHSESVGRMFEEAAVISGTVVDNDFDGATETVGDNDFAGVSETITANEVVEISENAFYSIEIPTFVRMPESEPAGNFTVQNAEKARRWTDTAAALWIVVTSGMLIYMAVSTACIRRKVKEAVRLSDNAYGCDRVSSPFILGLFTPCIYLPSDIDDTDRQYVLAHERIHIKRLDYIWKPLSFVLLSVYWFNPLMWVAYVLLCRDIELACDEKVLREYGDTIKRAYSETLINYSISRKSISACPLAFGETGVKGRVRNILNYRKPAFWVIVISIIACIAVAVCFLTNPDSDADTDVVMAGSESPSNAVLTEPEVIEPNETELVFFTDRDGNQLRFKVIDKFTAYEGNSVDSDTFEVLPGGSELLEFISTDENEWVQFKFKEQTGWVQYQLTSDPWISHYLVDTNGKLFPMRAVMVSTWEINNLGFSETPMQELNVILHGRNIDTDFETLLKADVVNGEEISSDYFDVYIKEVGKVNYFFNLHMYSIENRYGVYSGAPGSNMLVLALFDKTENYLMDVCYLSGDKFEVQLLDANGLPTALCKVFNKDDSGEYTLSETEFVRTGTEIEMNAAYELEAGRKYGVVVPGGRGTGYSVDYLHLLSIKENGEAGIAVANNDTLIAKIKSKFRVSVLENVTTENGAQVLDVEIDDDGIRHYEFGLERNDYSFEYVYWGQLVFFEYDETEKCMYMECIPSFFFKMAGNDATVDDGIEYPPKCRARLSIGENGSVSISDMEWLLADYGPLNESDSDVPGENADITSILQKMDACACTNISGWTSARQLIRVAYLENDGVVAAVYINPRTDYSPDIVAENGVFRIPDSVGRDFYLVTYSHANGEEPECRFVPSAAAPLHKTTQDFALLPTEGGVLWINTLPNDLGWFERNLAQIWYISEEGAMRYRFAENGDDYEWWRTHSSRLEASGKLVIYTSDTDEEFFNRLTNDPSVNTLDYKQKSDDYPEVTWTEASGPDVAQLCKNPGNGTWERLNTNTMTDQDALSLVCKCFGTGPMSASAYGTIIGIEHTDDGILLVLKILGVADDFQSIMVIKSNEELRAVTYEYFAGTKAVYRFDKNGIWISVTGDWQGSPVQTIYEGYVSKTGF